MSHIKDRLNDYYNQMKTLTEDHQMILANDALYMVEQLIDDLEQDKKQNKQWIRRLRGSISDGITIIQNEDGSFSEYDDTYDIVIHCETKEEQENVIALINSWMPLPEPYKEERT